MQRIRIKANEIQVGDVIVGYDRTVVDVGGPYHLEGVNDAGVWVRFDEVFSCKSVLHLPYNWELDVERPVKPLEVGDRVIRKPNGGILFEVVAVLPWRGGTALAVPCGGPGHDKVQLVDAEGWVRA